jgi:hypothetical protein
MDIFISCEKNYIEQVRKLIASGNKLKKCVKINNIKIYPAPRLNEHGESLDLNNNFLPNCPLCLQILNINIPNSIYTLSCGAMFHTKCILDFSKTNNKCPICDKELEKIVIKEMQDKRKIKEDKERAKQRRRFLRQEFLRQAEDPNNWL